MKKQALIFMSGYGSNTEVLLDYATNNPLAAFQVIALVTDRPQQSRTYEIAKKYNLDVIELDIFEFYRNHGETLINLATPERVKIRELWTQELSKKIKNYSQAIDFILLAGFEPLSNITQEYVALNVHPGDLTCEVNGERIYNGLGIKPLELAIIRGEKELRSSVIIAQEFTGKNSDIDAGPILGISAPVAVDLCGFEFEYLLEVYNNRPAVLPKGFSDDLRVVAKNNLEKLKYQGDHIVFPQATNDYASGKFKIDNNQLFYNENGKFMPIKTIEYFPDKTHKLIKN